MTKNKPTVLLDMDSTVYELDKPWLEYIEKELGEDVSEGFKQWDTHIQYPKSGVKVYDFLNREGMFYNLALIRGAQEAIKLVHDELGVNQVFLTTCTTRTGPWEKQEAIKRDFPYLSKNVLVTTGVKNVFDAILLVDDGPHNLDAFRGEGRLTCKIPYKYNEQTEADFTMYSWEEYPSLILKILRERFNWK